MSHLRETELLILRVCAASDGPLVAQLYGDPQDSVGDGQSILPGQTNPGSSDEWDYTVAHVG